MVGLDPAWRSTIQRKRLPITDLDSFPRLTIRGKPAKKREPRRWGWGGVRGRALAHLRELGESRPKRLKTFCRAERGKKSG